MKQTAVKWLVEQLQEHGYRGGFLPFLLFEQAKEMEKQQIIEAHGTKTKKSAGIANYLYTLSGEQYYNETYGSDDHIVDTNEMEKSATISKKEMVEISDEEIEKMLFHHSNEYAIGFKDAIKWYREQLKKKQ